MHAIVYHGPGNKAWEEVPEPQLTDDTDAVVRVDTVTICGTDLHIQGGRPGGDRRARPRSRGCAQGRPVPQRRFVRVLVAVASKHGATADIARAIADTVAGAGHQVDVREPHSIASVDGYEAVVAGSAVYAGHWLDAAKRFVTAHGDPLRSRPVWLFSSGPIGDPPRPEEAPVDVTDLMGASGAVEHRVFAGKLDRDQLGFAERAIVRALRAPEGDFRDWDEIRSWARSIAARLAEASAGSTGPVG